jgi:hypothetical protein
VLKRGNSCCDFSLDRPLLLFAAAMPLRAEPVVDDGGNLPDFKPLLEELLRPQQPTAVEAERRRLEEENRGRLQQNAQELEHMLAEQNASLAKVGPTFAITWVDGWQADLRAACLVGATGTSYFYDVRKDPAAQTTGVVNEREFLKAVDLAKSIGHVEWHPHHATENFSSIAWTMLLDGRITILQHAGDLVGAHPDPQVKELVKLIDGWCLDLPFWEGRPRPPY